MKEAKRRGEEKRGRTRGLATARKSELGCERGFGYGVFRRSGHAVAFAPSGRVVAREREKREAGARGADAMQALESLAVLMALARWPWFLRSVTAAAASVFGV